MEVNSEACHEKQEECIICLDDGYTEWRDLECHHRYHKQCIENWIAISARCPLCMKDVNENIVEIIPISENTIEMAHNISIRRYIIFISCIICIIGVMVLCSS
jgi:hypothetical protein